MKLSFLASILTLTICNYLFASTLSEKSILSRSNLSSGKSQNADVEFTDLKNKETGSKTVYSKEDLILELTGDDINNTDEVTLYSEVVNAFQTDDQLGLASRLQHMQRYFPESPYLDNTIYLVGVMALNHASYSDAIKSFSTIEKEFPHSNKRVSALFAKGIAYKKMDLPEFAKKVFKSLKNKYPGSPESFRADNELRQLR